MAWPRVAEEWQGPRIARSNTYKRPTRGRQGDRRTGVSFWRFSSCSHVSAQNCRFRDRCDHRFLHLREKVHWRPMAKKLEEAILTIRTSTSTLPSSLLSAVDDGHLSFARTSLAD